MQGYNTFFEVWITFLFETLLLDFIAERKIFRLKLDFLFLSSERSGFLFWLTIRAMDNDVKIECAGKLQVFLDHGIGIVKKNHFLGALLLELLTFSQF